MDIPYTVKARPDTGLFNAKVGIWLFLASEVMLFGALFSSYIFLRVGADPGTWPHGLLNIPIGTFNTTVLIASSVTVVLGWSALKVGNFKRYRQFQAFTVLCACGFLGIKSFEYRDKWTHYEIWKTDGTRMTGHIEGPVASPYFWNERTLASKKIESLKFKKDPVHYAEVKGAGSALAAAEHRGGGAHEEVEVKTSEIKRLSAFVPAHGTYFAIYFTLTALHGLHVLAGALVIAYIWGPNAAMWKSDPERYINRVEVSGLFWHFVDLVWIFLFPVLYLL
jgi:cytochrome c oxidase subunit 3